ncbi:T9SS type A sorting domain-containing protein [Labilibacter marinus]|uniref:T9SS type A sorting domain-containing protein n=1 Tax=Labilibacter marinus TaxID=1477105 RepID=UPI00094FC84B|nr:T9SS type A sorting domain-containing protein [Labilibacter marinus]
MKILKKFLISLIALIALSLNAQTNVSGVISTNSTWQKVNSPYIVVGNVMVQTNITLTIEPGVEIKFDGNYLIQVNGKLIAQGTSSNLISFKSNKTNATPGSWGSIYFSDGSSTESSIDYCNFEHGGSNKGTIICNEFITINETAITNSNSAAIYISRGFANITNSTFKDNDKGIEFYRDIYGDTNILNNKFENNRTDAIYVDIWSYNILIQENYINNSKIGITITNDGGSGATNPCTINSNKISNCETAVYVYGNGATIAHNLLINNLTSIDIQGGYNPFSYYLTENIITNSSLAINLIHRTYIGIVEILNNTICYNNSSADLIYLEGNYTHNDGVSPPDYNNYKFMYNTLYSNTCLNLINTAKFAKINNNNIRNNDADYLIYHRDIQDRFLNAESNYWNGLSNFQLLEKIYDWNDNALVGIVNYEPKLNNPNVDCPISSPSNVYKSPSGNGVNVSWSSNLESDVAGYKIHYNMLDESTFENFIDIGNTTSFVVNDIDILTEIVVTAYDNEVNNLNDVTEGHESWYSEKALIDNTTEIYSNNKIDNEKFVIWPTPADNKINIRSMNSESITNVKILSLDGKVLITNENIGLKSQINISHLNSGMYLIVIYNSLETKSIKFIKR